MFASSSLGKGDLGHQIQVGAGDDRRTNKGCDEMPSFRKALSKGVQNIINQGRNPQAKHNQREPKESNICTV